MLLLNIAFRIRTIFRKSHKHTLLYIYRFQRYAGESDLGVILPPPPLDIKGLASVFSINKFSDPKHILRTVIPKVVCIRPKL